MGIPGILREIGKGERVALSKLAISHLERTNRPLRIAIDAAIWNFQNAASQGGKNPGLRTFFFRLLKILALPIYPVFIYDGPNKPLTKRGRTVSRYGSCVENEMAKQLLSQFKFPSHTAPGEAEAECAMLQRNGIVDAVMSQDVDAIMFGSGITLRDWSQEGTRGNKTPTHVNLLDSNTIKERSGLDTDGMILVALLSGGDYDEGVAGFGSGLACEIAKAGFGTDLLALVKQNDQSGLQEWRERLEYELRTNESGYFKRRHLKLKLPEQFPDLRVLSYYIDPAVSGREHLPKLQKKWLKVWESQIDIGALRQYTATTFDWCWRSGARRFVRCFAQPLFQDQLRRGMVSQGLYTLDHITEDRQHFISDGLVEFRFMAVPADIVGIDIEAEEDNPEYATDTAQAEDPEISVDAEDAEPEAESEQGVQSPLKRKRAPWDPYAAERWWVPSTLLKIGLGSVVEDWQQRQRDIHADPKKFAARKCPRARKPMHTTDVGMKPGAIRAFLRDGVQPPVKSNGSFDRSTVQSPKKLQAEPASNKIPKSPSRGQRTRAPEQPSPSITRFFRPNKATVNPLNFDTIDIDKDDTSVTSVGQPNSDPVANSFSASQVSQVDDPFQSTILIESSPVVPVSAHDIQSREYSTNCAYSNGSPTRKRERTIKQQRQPTKDVPINEPPPIEFFFRPTRTVTKDHGPEHNVPDASIPSARPALKVHVTARESLPGTWKVSEEPESRTRAPRVSYVDLTND